MAHTPGPWHVNDNEPEDIRIEDDDELIVAATWAFVAPGRDGQEIANARLIASAPDLLAALKAALPYLEHSVKFYRYQQAGHEFWPNREEAEGNITEARAACAKAEG